MFKLRTYTGTLQFPTIDAAKTYMSRLYQQGTIRNGHTETVQGSSGEYITLCLSFGVVMETRV